MYGAVRPSTAPRTVLLTGANGFVGQHVGASLREAGHAVVAMLEPNTPMRSVPCFAERMVRADLRDDASLQRAVEGCAVVVHCAGLLFAHRSQAFFEVNHVGTRALVQAAREAGVVRMVYLSSLAARGPSSGGRSPVSDQPITEYGWSKLLAERELLASEVPTVVLRPPPLYGPGDPHTLAVFRLVQAGLAPRLGGGFRLLSLLHVHDLARAVVAALGLDAVPDAPLHLNGPEHLTSADLLGHVAKALDKRPVSVTVPAPAARVVAALLERWGQAVSRPVPFNSDKVRELLAPDWYVDAGEAQRVLGWRAHIPPAEGTRATAQWYREQGWL